MPMDFGSRLDTRKRSLVQLHRVAIVGGSFSDFHTFKTFYKRNKTLLFKAFQPKRPARRSHKTPDLCRSDEGG